MPVREGSRGCGSCKSIPVKPPLCCGSRRATSRLDDAARGGAHPAARPQKSTMSLSDPPNDKRFGVRTRLVHAGRDPSEQHGFVNTPIYRGSTVLYPTVDDLQHRRGRYVYGTKGTPTTEALETAWSALA